MVSCRLRGQRRVRWKGRVWARIAATTFDSESNGCDLEKYRCQYILSDRKMQYLQLYFYKQEQPNHRQLKLGPITRTCVGGRVRVRVKREPPKTHTRALGLVST